MVEVKMPHEGLEQHLCLLHNTGYLSTNMEDCKKLVSKPNFVCKGCGCIAANEKNLCPPEKL